MANHDYGKFKRDEIADTFKMQRNKKHRKRTKAFRRLSRELREKEGSRGRDKIIFQQ